MKKKFLFSICLVLICINIVNGQDTLIKAENPFPKAIFTFSPLNLINIRVPAVQVGIEYPISNYLSIQQEVGYIFRNNQNSNQANQFLRKRGLRIRTELRYYYSGLDDEDNYKDYFGFQFRYWKFSSPMESQFFREGGQYQQRLSFDITQSAIGGGVSYGSNIISKRNLVLDAGASAGLIYFNNSPNGIPEDAIQFIDSFFFRRDHSVPYKSTQFYLLITLKFGLGFN